MSTCSVCIAKYNKSTYTKVVCACDFECCRSCAQTYLLGTIQEPHCMQCRNKWTLEFVKHNLGASFVNGALKEHQTKIITEKSLAKREELMPLAIEYRIDQKEKKKIAELKAKVSELKKQMNAYQDQINEIKNERAIRNGGYPYFRNDVQRNNEVYRLRMQGIPYAERDTAPDRNQYIGGGAAPAPPPPPKPEPKQKFIMPCQNADCNGMLNKNYCCELCDKKTCSKCLEVESEDHKCNPDSVESAKLLRNSTKPCPKCGTRISKIDGCDQMWCVECKTAFSWNKGTIETNHIHNPHYFEYLRKNKIEAPRNPYEALTVCGNRRDNAVRFLLRKPTEENTKIANFLQYVNHIEESTINELNTSIETKTNNVQPLELKYLIGELTKEELSEKLMANHKHVIKDNIFKDIYSAIVMMGDQICGDIGQGVQINHTEILDRILRFTAYFNMELIKALMLHDSKRIIEMFKDDTRDFRVSYKSKKEMTADLDMYSKIYNLV